MDSFKPFQPMTTVRVGATGGEVVQSRSGWLDLGDLSTASVRIHILSLTGTLILESSTSEEGPWQEIDSWNAVTEVTLSLLTYFKAENVFTRFVRWRFVQSGTAGVASFEMRWA